MQEARYRACNLYIKRHLVHSVTSSVLNSKYYKPKKLHDSEYILKSFFTGYLTSRLWIGPYSRQCGSNLWVFQLVAPLQTFTSICCIKCKTHREMSGLWETFWKFSNCYVLFLLVATTPLQIFFPHITIFDELSEHMCKWFKCQSNNGRVIRGALIRRSSWSISE